MLKFLGKFLDSNERELKKLQPLVAKINALEDNFVKLTGAELKKKTDELRNRLTKNETLDDILPEAFAAAREAAKRTIGQRHFDVQIMGGIILHQGKIAEMKTGEGKTLVATLPLYLNALAGKGCHLITVNDYLAKRDCNWMGPIYHLLGVSVAAIGHESSFLYSPGASSDENWPNLAPISRQEAYHADITYGTNNEFGFDYLRDNMVIDASELRQRELDYAIVDEVDSILIDEARTPLIISAPAEESASLYRQFAELVKRLKKDADYTVDEKMRVVTLTDEGMKTIEKLLGLPNIYDSRSINLVHHLEEALKAEVLFKRNRDYVVKDDEVIIVDEFTGRLMPGRRYSEGLHQAIEAKEEVEVKRESDTLATISFQNLFRLYQKLAGMTGTAATEAEEFYKIYKLDVIEIPTHRPMIRSDYEDQIYKTEEQKFKAVVEEIKKRHLAGQPLLVGTISIEKSEKLSRLLRNEGIKHEVLNAKHHEREAKIISQAGRLGAVTVATNMAGRGVDIMLGGGAPPPSEIRNPSASWRTEIRNKSKIEQWKSEHAKVIELGGLQVIGTERHEARRIDNQLRGRSGRQGDPGSSQFFVSMEDDLMRVFGGERMKGIMERLGLPDNQPIQHRLISRSIEAAQRKVEGHNFDIRKHLVEYDDVMNKHRQAIYKKRQRILELKNENWLHQEILALLKPAEKRVYEEKVKKYGFETMQQLEKMVYLRSIDLLWIEHLNAMDSLREGIGLRGYGQRDPLVEYKQEAYFLFQRLLQTIDNQAVEILLKAEIQAAARTDRSSLITAPSHLVEQGADEAAAAGTFGGVEVTVRKRGESSPASNSLQSSTSFSGKVGRNEPCPCGSGKKYKKCHGR